METLIWLKLVIVFIKNTFNPLCLVMLAFCMSTSEGSPDFIMTENSKPHHYFQYDESLDPINVIKFRIT